MLLLVFLLFSCLQLTNAAWRPNDDEFFQFSKYLNPCDDFEGFVCLNNSGKFNLISVEFQKLSARLSEGPPAYFYSAVMPKFLDEAVWINATNNMGSVGCPLTEESFQIARNIWSQMNAVLIAYNLFKKTNPSDEEFARFFVGYMASRCENNFRLDGFFENGNLKTLSNDLVRGFKDFSDIFQCHAGDTMYTIEDRLWLIAFDIRLCMINVML